MQNRGAEVLDGGLRSERERWERWQLRGPASARLVRCSSETTRVTSQPRAVDNEPASQRNMGLDAPRLLRR